MSLSLNIPKLMKDLIPHYKRTKVSGGNNRLVEYLQAASVSINTNYDNFVTLRDTIIRDLSFTGQKIYMQERLNQDFDSVLKRIFITHNFDFLNDNFTTFDAESPPPTFMRFDSEGGTPFFIREQSEYDLEIDFVVNIPLVLSLDLNEVTDIVNKYRSAGKTFEIIEF